MAPAPGRFADLGPRVLSAVALAVPGFAALWFGGPAFMGLVALVVGVMVWELSGLALPQGSDGRMAAALGGVAAVAVVLSRLVAPDYVLPLALLPAVAAILLARGGRRLFAPLAALLVLAGFGLVHLREDLGFAWVLWLVLVVMATDILGYFAGKLLGGPRLWPRVSPRKTWAGTLAGWAGAAAVGAGFVLATGAGAALVALSVAASMAAQVGDISESAVKRRAGVKDASRLIPGHGGLFDRFDGLFAATVFFLVAERVVAFPPPGGG